MGLFSQYSVNPQLDLEVKPIPLTGNSVLTSSSVLNNKSELQSNPITYSPPKLDSGFVNSTLNSLSSFLDKSDAQALANRNLEYAQQIQDQNTSVQEQKNNNNKTIIIVGISVVSVVVLSIIVISIAKHKK
jgi:hypothetical protein